MERSKLVMNWDKIDPATGLSIGCKVACEIIDGLNHHELHLFNAPRRDNPNITSGELVERYMAQKSQSGEVDCAKHEAGLENKHGDEDERAETSANGGAMKGKVVEGSAKAIENDLRSSLRR